MNSSATTTTKTDFLKGFLLKLLAFFAVIFIADFTLGTLLKKYYFKQHSGFDAMATYAIEKTDAQTIILGSSRAKNIYNPDLFESRLHQTCYNAGRYGYPIFYHYAILKAVLNRYTPNTVILSFDAGNFSKGEDAYDKLASLLPYYENHPEIQPIVDLKGPFEKLKKLSHIYPYNSLALAIMAGNRGKDNAKFERSKGFLPINHVIEPPYPVFDYTKEKELDSVKINIYKAFMKDCMAAKIKLVIICPPYQIQATGIDKSIMEGKRIAADFNVPFLDYSRDTFFTGKPSLFADYRHLNEQGVEIFDNAVLDTIAAIR